MEDSREKKSKKEYVKEGVCFIGCVAPGVYFGIKADCGLGEFNLGQVCQNPKTKEEWWKYLSIDSRSGRPTGHGYAFEDAFFRACKKMGHDVGQVDMKKNGADYIVDGIPCQLKLGSSPKAVFGALFKQGKYRYPGQTIITTKEMEEGVRKLVRENSHRFGGAAVAVNPPGMPKISRKEVDAQWHRGLASLRLDAKDILSDGRNQKMIALGVLMVFCSYIGIGAIKEYGQVLEEAQKAGTDENILKLAGTAVKRSIKKRWKGAALTALVTTAGAFTWLLAKRQSLRPK